jgi:CDP-diacylglycerol--serine O-phosphatidyltransferase
VAPALILYLWSLQETPRLGWFAALAFAICCVLRLARFNARIDMVDEPRKAAGFLTGVPAPVGAGLAFLPVYLWIASDENLFREPVVVGLWSVIVAFLLISPLPTLAWGKLAPRRSLRLPFLVLVALVVAGLVNEPWLTLVVISVVYLLLIPVGLISYARIRRPRAARAPEPGRVPEP